MGEAKRKARHLSGRTWAQGKISVIANEVHCFDWSGTREDAIDLQKRYLARINTLASWAIWWLSACQRPTGRG